MKQSNGLNTWLGQLTSRKRIQVAAVELANKMARMVWAVLSKGEAYRPPLLIELPQFETTGLQLTPGGKRLAWRR